MTRHLAEPLDALARVGLATYRLACTQQGIDVERALAEARVARGESTAAVAFRTLTGLCHRVALTEVAAGTQVSPVGAEVWALAAIADDSIDGQLILATWPGCPARLLAALACGPMEVRARVAANPTADRSIIEALLDDPSRLVVERLLASSRCWVRDLAAACC